jgi:RNA polymerase sigma-70 factor (ECF subfamily)
VKDLDVDPYRGEEPATPLTLLDKVRRNEAEACERLVKLYKPLVLYWCKQAKLRPEDSVDVAQEVFLSVWKNLGTFRRDRQGDTFRGWMWTITRNKVCDFNAPPGCKGQGGSEAQGMLQDLPSPDPERQADADAQAAEKNIVLRRAVELIESGFTKKTRQAFCLLVAGWTGEEVANKLKISREAVYLAKARIVKRLRKEFGDLLEWP